MQSIYQKLQLDEPEQNYEYKEEPIKSPFDNLKEDKFLPDIDNFLNYHPKNN